MTSRDVEAYIHFVGLTLTAYALGIYLFYRWLNRK